MERREALELTDDVADGGVGDRRARAARGGSVAQLGLQARFAFHRFRLHRLHRRLQALRVRLVRLRLGLLVHAPHALQLPFEGAHGVPAVEKEAADDERPG